MEIWKRDASGKKFEVAEALEKFPLKDEPLDTYLERTINGCKIEGQYWIVFSSQEVRTIRAIAKMFMAKGERSHYPLEYDFLTAVLQNRFGTRSGIGVTHIPADGSYELDADWRLAIAVSY